MAACEGSQEPVRPRVIIRQTDSHDNSVCNLKHQEPHECAEHREPAVVIALIDTNIEVIAMMVKSSRAGTAMITMFSGTTLS